MSEFEQRIADFLKTEYGINSPEELMIAAEHDCGVNIGIFTEKPELGGKA